MIHKYIKRFSLFALVSLIPLSHVLAYSDKEAIAFLSQHREVEITKDMTNYRAGIVFSIWESLFPEYESMEDFTNWLYNHREIFRRCKTIGEFLTRISPPIVPPSRISIPNSKECSDFFAWLDKNPKVFNHFAFNLCVLCQRHPEVISSFVDIVLNKIDEELSSSRFDLLGRVAPTILLKWPAIDQRVKSIKVMKFLSLHKEIEIIPEMTDYDESEVVLAVWESIDNDKKEVDSFTRWLYNYKGTFEQCKTIEEFLIQILPSIVTFNKLSITNVKECSDFFMWLDKNPQFFNQFSLNLLELCQKYPEVIGLFIDIVLNRTGEELSKLDFTFVESVTPIITQKWPEIEKRVNRIKALIKHNPLVALRILGSAFLPQ